MLEFLLPRWSASSLDLIGPSPGHCEPEDRCSLFLFVIPLLN